MTEASSDVTRLLEKLGSGDPSALDRLIPIVYEELRRIAHHHLGRERPDHTLTTTALVHECYLDLTGSETPGWENRAHFLAVASKAMRHILVDYARRRTAKKRGGRGQVRVPLESAPLAVLQRAEELLALDQALARLSERDERLGRVVECRYFGGMQVDETAEALGISPRTVKRDWRRAKTYLYRELRPGGALG